MCRDGIFEPFVKCEDLSNFGHQYSVPWRNLVAEVLKVEGNSLSGPCLSIVAEVDLISLLAPDQNG